MCNQSIPIDINLSIDCFWKSIPIDNHTNLCHRLVIDYQYQSINRYQLVLTDINCHQLSISSIGYPGVFLLPPGWMLVHYRITSSIKLANTHLCTWVERGTVREKVSCPRTRHNVPGWPGLEPGPLDPGMSSLWGHFASHKKLTKVFL